MRIPLWPTLLTILGVIILCSLGTWQLQRLAWKNDITAKLEATYDQTPAPSVRAKELTAKEFTFGRVRGRLATDKAILLGTRMKDEKPGADLIVPLVMKDGRTLLVDMGFASGDLKSQPIHHVKNKQVWFEGLARPITWNDFTPKNDPAKDRWYRADIEEIAKAKNLKNPIPVLFFAERASHKFDAAFPNNERFAPSNNHLQYALFWYAMAATLIAVYVLRFLRKPKV